MSCWALGTAAHPCLPIVRNNTQETRGAPDHGGGSQPPRVTLCRDKLNPSGLPLASLHVFILGLGQWPRLLLLDLLMPVRSFQLNKIITQKIINHIALSSQNCACD